MTTNLRTQARFDAAVAAAPTLTALSNEQKLRLYALFKRAGGGLAFSVAAPSKMKVVAQAKWEA